MGDSIVTLYKCLCENSGVNLHVAYNIAHRLECAPFIVPRLQVRINMAPYQGANGVLCMNDILKTLLWDLAVGYPVFFHQRRWLSWRRTLTPGE